jgi:hypothetical protein
MDYCIIGNNNKLFDNDISCIEYNRSDKLCLEDYDYIFINYDERHKILVYEILRIFMIRKEINMIDNKIIEFMDNNIKKRESKIILLYDSKNDLLDIDTILDINKDIILISDTMIKNRKYLLVSNILDNDKCEINNLIDKLYYDMDIEINKITFCNIKLLRNIYMYKKIKEQILQKINNNINIDTIDREIISNIL